MKKVVLIALSIFLTFSAKAQLWDSLRGGLGNVPRIMYADTIDNYLYVGGVFIEVDDKPIRGMARWNGLQWDSLGAGIDNLSLGWPQNTFAITRYNNEIYVGGAFTSAGSIWSEKIAKWNGTQWDSLLIKPFRANNSGAVCTLQPIGGYLYMGGTFDTVAGFPCQSIARWDETNWSSLNFPVLQNTYINAIAEYNGEIYASGSFRNTLNDSISCILRWDGFSWRSVGGGIKGTVANIASMAVYNGELYVAGIFYQSAGNVGDHIQKWNGTTWSNVGGSTGGGNGQIHKLLVHDGKLYALGVFDFAGGIPANYFASWDGTDWCGIGSTFSNVLTAGCVYKDTLYVGGGFRTIDVDSFSRIAKWVGGNYTSVCGNTTDIRESETEVSSVSFYPNPVGSIGTFYISGNQKISIIKIYDQLGREVWRKETDENEIEFFTDGFASGLYFYRVEQLDGKSSTGKFIVEK